MARLRGKPYLVYNVDVGLSFELEEDDVDVDHCFVLGERNGTVEKVGKGSLREGVQRWSIATTATGV